MVTDLLNTILKDLERHIQIAGLHSDENQSCRLVYNNGFEVQIELDPSGDFVCIGTKLGEAPQGKYRHTLFKEALKANGLPPPQAGTFALSEKNNTLIFYNYLFAKDLSGEKLATALIKLREQALLWREAMSRGELPELGKTASGVNRPKGMFGL